MSMLNTYLRLLLPCRGMSIAAIVLAGIAAVAEGFALAALIPLLDVFQAAQAPSSNGFSPVWGGDLTQTCCW